MHFNPKESTFNGSCPTEIPLIFACASINFGSDHKQLLALFGPQKVTPGLAANRLARWALMLSQYESTVEDGKKAPESRCFTHIYSFFCRAAL